MQLFLNTDTFNEVGSLFITIFFNHYSFGLLHRPNIPFVSSLCSSPENLGKKLNKKSLQNPNLKSLFSFLNFLQVFGVSTTMSTLEIEARE